MEKEFPIDKIIIVPGNGCNNIKKANFYHWLELEIKKYFEERSIEMTVICETMPDPFQAKEKICN